MNINGYFVYKKKKKNVRDKKVLCWVGHHLLPCWSDTELPLEYRTLLPIINFGFYPVNATQKYVKVDIEGAQLQDII